MATLSGVTTVATAGTAVPLGDMPVNGAIAVHVPEANTGVMYIGNVDGDVSSANGLELAKGETLVIQYIVNLSVLIVDAATNGDKLSWMILEFIEQ